MGSGSTNTLYKKYINNTKIKDLNKIEEQLKTIIKKFTKGDKPGNAMMSLNLYKTGDTWMFDDETFGIKAEPFVLGMSEIISSYLTKGKDRCTAIFSLNEFPGCDTLDLEYEEAGGGWYNVSKSNFSTTKGMRGWLCPVTRVYLDAIPKNIYYKVEG
jgi:hypothetical protein